MSCPEFRVWLRAYVDGELGWADRLSMRLHLLRCPDCTAVTGRIRALASGVAALDQPQSAAVRPPAWQRGLRLLAEVGLALAIATACFLATDAALRTAGPRGHPNPGAPYRMAQTSVINADRPLGPPEGECLLPR